jgi:hypothetical protein
MILIFVPNGGNSLITPSIGNDFSTIEGFSNDVSTKETSDFCRTRIGFLLSAKLIKACRLAENICGSELDAISTIFIVLIILKIYLWHIVFSTLNLT